MRCYFRHLGHIVAVENLSGAIGDEQAIKEAERLFQNYSDKFSEFKVWGGNRLIYRFIMGDEM